MSDHEWLQHATVARSLMRRLRHDGDDRLICFVPFPQGNGGWIRTLTYSQSAGDKIALYQLDILEA